MTPHARGFTLLEVALAAALGSIVVLAALSMFASLDSAQKVGQQTFDQATSAALTHEAVSNAIQNLMMSNTVAPPRNSQGERLRPGQDAPDAPVDPRDLERPRLLLELDQSLPAVMVDPASQNGELMQPQRLEVTLRSRPVFVFGIEREESLDDLARLLPAPPDDAIDAALDATPLDNAGVNSGANGGATSTDGSTLDGRRDTSRTGRGQDRTAGESGTGSVGRAGSADERPRRPSVAERRAERERERVGGVAADEVTTELVPGVRGAFELEFDPGVAAGGLEDEPGWVLWWRQLYPVVEAPIDMDPMPGQRVGAVRLMGNIASASWKMLYTKKSGVGQGTPPERLSEHTAVWADDLPSYVELDILSNTGDHNQWTFEVGWGVSGEPGTVQSTTGAVAAIGRGAASTSGSTGTAGTTTDGARSRTPSEASSGSSHGSSTSGSSRRGSSSGTSGSSQERRK